ncbi:class I mannose-6-phosphate isomerase [Naasia aerilata]|uniref:Mannose-6-phosphate isomerase n=1 Tax=Naasia aerilata TaxID=1162966 RepID=A0ABM8GBG9_9MICO|nr:class I mannose-6-phosphate isomerase [Naasia aerilata]BDZ45569.1 hypothetical protein GCM10025866_14780 [Naasia aerilata]
MSLAPVALGPNQPDRPYRGGAGIAPFRRVPQPSPFSPEDFVGSTTEIFAGGGVGLSTLPSGELLRDAVAADPVGYLGAQHVGRFGPSTELLVKLLDTGERLFVHLHPDGPFAAEHLALPHGKTEAWIVTAVADADTSAHLGFTRDVTAEEVEAWVDGQDSAGMLGAMHRVPLEAGTTLLVPAGMPHAIGAGVTLVELQEPSDLSILLEYAGYRGLGPADAFLGLERSVALGALDRRAVTPERIAELLSSRRTEGGALRSSPQRPMASSEPSGSAGRWSSPRASRSWSSWTAQGRCPGRRGARRLARTHPPRAARRGARRARRQADRRALPPTGALSRGGHAGSGRRPRAMPTLTTAATAQRAAAASQAMP